MKREEDVLQGKVFELCTRLGLKVLHIKPSLTKRGTWHTSTSPDGKGWPDLSICGPGGLIFREIKAPKGRIRPEQRTWLMDLVRAGQDAAIWRPADLTSGLIPATLQRLAKSRPSTTEESS